MTDIDPTKRFSNRVDNYVRYRPSYPPEAISFLMDQGLDRSSLVADVGSGTGILSGLLLGNVDRVFAVEPNDEMRSAAEARLGGRAGFVSLAARAEATTLPDHSVNMVTAAQSFHWFDTPRALAEFRRILRAPKRLALIWNIRLSDTPFLGAYETLLETYGTDYQRVNHQKMSDQDLAGIFIREFQLKEFDNLQQLDLEGLKGRLFSSSTTPTPQDPGYQAMLQGIESAFRRHQVDGHVTIRYKTQVFSGCI